MGCDVMAVSETVLWTGLLSGLVGSVIGGTAALIGVVIEQKHQKRRERVADRRRQRDAKVERLRADYVTLAVAAHAIEFAGKQVTVRVPGETEEQRFKRVTDILANVAGPSVLGAAVMRLRLEADTEEVVKMYERVDRAFVNLQLGMATDRSVYPASKLKEDLDTLRDGVPTVVMHAKHHLDALVETDPA
jgi:hypothetical protein